MFMLLLGTTLLNNFGLLSHKNVSGKSLFIGDHCAGLSIDGFRASPKSVNLIQKRLVFIGWQKYLKYVYSRRNWLRYRWTVQDSIERRCEHRMVRRLHHHWHA